MIVEDLGLGSLPGSRHIAMAFCALALAGCLVTAPAEKKAEWFREEITAHLAEGASVAEVKVFLTERELGSHYYDQSDAIFAMTDEIWAGPVTTGNVQLRFFCKSSPHPAFPG